MAKRNPTSSKDSLDLTRVFPEIDHLPNPIGVNQENLREANEFPGHANVVGSGISNMKPNDGDQRDVADPGFATGRDLRHFPNRGGLDPTPAKPGA